MQYERAKTKTRETNNSIRSERMGGLNAEETAGNFEKEVGILRQSKGLSAEDIVRKPTGQRIITYYNINV